MESGAACEGRCRPVIVSPRVVTGDAARARAVQTLLDAQSVDFRSDDCWLTFLDYTVHHDDHGVLDVTFRASGSGAYPSTQVAHIAIDLTTLERIRANDAFSSRSHAALAASVNGKARAAWNAAAKLHAGALFERPMPAFGREHLDHFIVHADGVTFFFDFGFPHAAEAATPVSEFAFTRAEIRRFVAPEGPLGFLAVTNEPSPGSGPSE
jgi:hypothetical protein